jgi:predicted dinucleotide-binding enzyme
MKIGFVGAGRMAQMLTPHLVAAGHQVILTNSRGPESLKDLVATLGTAVSAASVADMVEAADIVVLATPWGKTKDAVAQASSWRGRVVIDPTNNRTKPGPDGLIDIGGRGSSAVVAEMLPGADVVKTLNYEPIPIFGEGLSSAEPKAMFVAGDSAAAKAKVSELFRSLGATPIDVGDLAAGDNLLMGGRPLAMKMRLLKPDEARELLQSAAAV